MLVPRGPTRAGLLSLIIAVPLALLAGPVASASAALFVMEKPTNGTVTKVTTPTFSGTAEDLEDPVTVVIHEGASLSGPALPALSAPVSEEGTWSVTAEALAEGTYTAEAEQIETAGMGQTNKAGPVTFTIDDKPPSVTLKQPTSPSGDTTPVFEGSASESTEVTVDVYAGSKAEGGVVASATAEGNGGDWTSHKASPALSGGEYTAVATQQSSIGNGPGESLPVHFVVDTESPVVTLKQPTTPSKDTTPAFSGNASADTPVVIHIYEGTKAQGTVVATAEATGTGGSWTSDEASPALKTGYHEYTAVATQEDPVDHLEGKSEPKTFVVDTEAPGVTLNQPAKLSNDTEPSFSGTATGVAEVVVKIYAGSKVEGEPVAAATAPPPGAGNSWTSDQAGPALAMGRHTYTAVATEESPLGNEEGKSEPRTFEVDTEAPKVTLNQPAKLSGETKPSFSGSASEATEVVVRVYEGSKAEGTPVATAKTTASGGSWSTTPEELSNALPTGKHMFTAVAKEKSGLDNEEGRSEERIFEVDTETPKVTLNQPAKLSKETRPAFSGTASEATEVVVHVYEGSKASGTEVASAKTTASGGTWLTTGEQLSKALPTGKHTFTAVAKEKSGLGNEEGRSEERTFEVDTETPKVTLNQPAKLSNDTTPAFSGSASEATEVVVRVYEGGKAEGTPLASANTAASGGSWSTTPEELSNALPSGKRTFTAVAKEKSGLGNEEGRSEERTFEVNTEPPVVTLTQPKTPTSNTEPPFSGMASESTEVVVHVFEGSTEVAKAKTTASGGTWSTTGLSKALQEGKHTFTVYATEKSGITGNKEGKSSTLSFEVDTEPPVVTLAEVPSPTNNQRPSFSGAASENTEVVVHVYEGLTEVAKAKTTASGGTWSTTGSALSKELPEGKHTFTAYAIEKSGLDNGEGTSAPRTFEVNTESPKVTLAKVSSPTNDVTPTFSGTASEATEVLVQVYEGTKAEGSAVTSAKTTASGGGWATTVEELTKPLPEGKHTFTAVATEKSGLNNKSGTSETRTFEVNTEPPKVTLAKVASPTNDTTPSFSGDAGEPTEVVVRVYEGAKAEGTPAATAKTTASAGSWLTTGEQLSPALPKGKRTFTAVAMEKSGLNNPEGRSEERTFELNTEPPKVTLNQPTTPSKETKPSFSGMASENTEVVVHVFAGSKGEGEEVASAKTTASGGSWTTTGSELSKALSEGKNTFSAYATEASGLDNGPGKSAVVIFEVNTNPPTVTLNQPTTPSKETKPSFGGAASENTEVVVHVFAGSKGEGEEVALAKTTASGGSWTTTGAELSKALSEGKNTFSAYATEVSGLGNKAGKSSTVVFEVDTEPPAVTLNQPKTPSSITTPTFGGTASEAGPAVTVNVYEGKKVEGEPVTSVTSGADRSSESWTAGSAKLATGKHFYTAIAIEPSGLGNKQGESKPVTFEVNTLPPTVTLEPLPLRSNETKPSFSGTASEAGTITVKLTGETTATPHKKVEESLQVKVTAKEGGPWKTSSVTPPLEEGEYEAVATEPSEIENSEGKHQNGVGESAPAPFAVVLGAPNVKLKEIARSRNTQPSFSGTAEDKTPVTVKIYEGSSAIGNIISTASEAGARKEGIWTSGKTSPALPTGRHTFTAVAVEKSEIEGNRPGESEPRTFEVDTEAPTVTLNQPKTPSNQTKPTFTGIASENTEVKVHVFAGTKAEGAEVASATTTAEGGWSATLTKALQEGKRTFTAYATEKSGITGNEEGESKPVSFEVDTLPPTVTLNPPPSPANDAVPSFSGTASDTTPVTVSVYSGGVAEGSPVAWIEAVGADGAWGPFRVGAPGISYGDELLPNGEYTAVARQPSSLGNPTGVSKAVTFIVETRPPIVVALPAQIFSRTSVELHASIDPNEGALTACGFEYGTTPAYGTALECAFSRESVECTFSASASEACEFPSDEGFVEVYARLFHPDANTTYYFQITAADGEQANSASGTFTTPASLSSAGGGGSSGGSGGSSNTATTSAAHNAVGEVEAAIAAHLPPSGRNATIAALLKRGGFASVFKAPRAGTATIDWWYVPPGAKLSAKAASKKKPPAPVLVASGKRTFYEAGSGVIKVRLTAAGRGLLKRSKRVRLTAKAVFTASGKTLYRASKSFELK